MRRLVATLLSPLASAYVLVVALVYVVSRRLTIWWGLLALLPSWDSVHTRAALAALAVGLVLLALAQRRVVPAVLAAVSVAAGAAFLVAYPTIGPSTSYTEEELEFLRQNAEEEPEASTDPLSPSESSTASHLRNLRDGMRAVLEHPQGYGLGNAGVVAKRTGSRSRRASPPTRRSGSTRASRAWRLPPLEPRPARGAAAPRGLARRRIRGRAPARPADGRHRRPLARRRAVGRGGRARLATPGAPGSRGGRDGGRARAGPEPAAPSPDA